MITEFRIIDRIKLAISRGGIKLARACLPQINKIPESQLSLIYPFRDEIIPSAIENTSDELLRLALDVAIDALSIDLSNISARIRSGPKWPDIYPGEHYKLLAALVNKIKPSYVIEIGTFLGISSLTMKKYLPQGGRIVTFDIIPWGAFQDTCFDRADFDDGKLTQIIADLASPAIFDAHRELISQANIIFLDGPKNRTFERAFLKQLLTVKFSGPCLLVIDDIRLWNMLDIWREIEEAKLDFTSLGHFSGTGLVMLQ